jgi:hypothetical protein
MPNQSKFKIGDKIKTKWNPNKILTVESVHYSVINKIYFYSISTLSGYFKDFELTKIKDTINYEK